MWKAPFIHVRIADPGLRFALEHRLMLEARLASRICANGTPGNGDIVVMLSSETTPFECLSMREHGVKSLVLAPAWSESERERFMAAGATCYLPVELPPSRLVAVLHATGQPPA